MTRYQQAYFPPYAGSVVSQVNGFQLNAMNALAKDGKIKHRVSEGEAQVCILSALG